MKITNETNEIAYGTCNELLQKDLSHFDGNHKRAKSFVTLSGGVYHQLLRKQVIFVTMNCNYEDSSTVAKCWCVFNKAFQEVNSTKEFFLFIVGQKTRLPQILMILLSFNVKIS